MRIALAGPVRLDALLPWLDTPGGYRPNHALRTGGTPVTGIAVGLLERGCELIVVGLDAHAEREIRLAGPGLRVYIGPSRTARRARDGFRRERRYVAQALAKEAPSIVHAHWTYEYALGALATGIPTLITVRDWAPAILRLTPDPFRAAKVILQATTLLRGQHFTTISPYMQRPLQRWLRRPVPIVPNGIPEDAFSWTPKRLNEDRPSILAVNVDFGKRKNVSALIQAFAEVRRSSPHARLSLVGRHFRADGPAHVWARERGLDSGVEWHGALSHDHVQSLMADADLFVHPSLEESFGMVLLEAMAQGVPVIAGERSGAVPWVLDGGHAGVLTDVRSPRAIAQAIVYALTNRDDWERYSEAGRARAWGSFRLPLVVDAYFALYRTILRTSADNSHVVGDVPRKPE